jgi:hypothetical protein
MATRRRYKSGGVVPSTPETVDVSAPAVETIVVPPPVVADGGSVVPPAAPDSHEPVRAMLDASRHAEQLQWQRQAIEREIASYQISDFKKDFLRQNPMLLNDAIKPISQRVHQAALAAGVPDDTPEMNAAMLAGIHEQIYGRGQVAPPPPVPDEHQMDKRDVEAAAQELAAEAEAIRAPNAPVIAPPPPRRSLPISAPVSRDIPTASGQRFSQQTSVTLSKEERELSHGAYHWLPKAEAEREYAKQKSIMLSRRADGTLNE